MFCRWHVYAFALIWIAGGGLEAFGTVGLQALWMQAQNSLAGRVVYTVREINYYPTGATAVSIVALLGTAMWTDRSQKRYQANLFTAACLVVSASIMLAYDQTSVGAKFFAFYLSGVSYAGQAVNFSWANEVLRFDSQERSVVLAAMNVASTAVNIALSTKVFPATDAPRWRRGMISILVFAVSIVALSIGARWLQLRNLYSAKPKGDDVLAEASEEEAEEKKELDEEEA